MTFNYVPLKGPLGKMKQRSILILHGTLWRLVKSLSFLTLRAISCGNGKVTYFIGDIKNVNFFFPSRNYSQS